MHAAAPAAAFLLPWLAGWLDGGAFTWAQILGFSRGFKESERTHSEVLDLKYVSIKTKKKKNSNKLNMNFEYFVLLWTFWIIFSMENVYVIL